MPRSKPKRANAERRSRRAIIFNDNEISKWVDDQVALEPIQEELFRDDVRRRCYDITERPCEDSQYVHFARHSGLFWMSAAQGKARPVPISDPHDYLDSNTIGYQYNDAFLQFLEASGLDPRRKSVIEPIEVAFCFAKGNIPGKDWSLHHLYGGAKPFYTRRKFFDALKDGYHCTQAAGIVALHSDFDKKFFRFRCVVNALRYAVYKKFRYDPYSYFEPDQRQHDIFGFVK